jgi:hypothetical protein
MSPDQANDLLNLQFLDLIPLWVVYVLAVVALLLASEIGFRLSHVMQRYRPDQAEASVSALNGATLALVAFLLAFVTSAAVNNFANRRQAVVAEANAIGTTYLRAGYLPEPDAEESRQLLREYVDLRIALNRDNLAQTITRSEEIQNDLWSRAETLAKEDSSPTLALYISSLNEVIDLQTERINVGLVARIPWTLVYGLFFMALLSLGLIGLHAGYVDKRNPIALLFFVLIMSVVFLLIVDLGRSDEGLLKVSQQAMLDLQRQLNVP